MQSAKKCTKCGHIWSIKLFYKSSSQSDGLQTKCISCCRNYYCTNRDKICKNRKIKRNKIAATKLATRTNDIGIRHGMSHLPEHGIWCHIIERCHAQTYSPKYQLYGGRGIKVCDRWRYSFINFYHDMGKRPSETHTIERKNTNKDYCPSNCLWATQKEQQNNRRNNHILSFDGKKLTIAEWSDVTKISQGLIWARIMVLGWTVRRTLITQPRICKRHKIS